MEQLIYARWLAGCTHFALALLVAAFLAYALGAIEPLVDLTMLTRVWHLPASEYLAVTGAPTGWGWLGLLDKGDYLNLVAIAMLGLVTIVCYLRILPVYLSRGERLRATIAFIQVAVLLAAASGMLAGG